MTTEYEKYHLDTFEHRGIIWGEKIDASNDGKPLPWLKGDEVVFCYWGETVGSGPYPVDCVHGWDEGFQIRLPADHQHYHASDLAPAPTSVDEPISTLEHAPKTLRVDGPQGVMVIPRTIDEWVAFNGDVPEKHWSFTLDVLDALGLILPDAPKPPVSRAQRFEQETGIRASKKVLAALEWAANNPE